MTHALLILRTGQAITILDGPMPVNEAVDSWKQSVNADLAVPPGPGDPNPPAIEVVELVVRRTHKVRGYHSPPPQAQPESGSEEPPLVPVEETAAAEEAPPVEEAPSAEEPDPKEEAPAADPPRGKRKS